jgi:hypothetical protein
VRTELRLSVSNPRDDPDEESLEAQWYGETASTDDGLQSLRQTGVLRDGSEQTMPANGSRKRMSRTNSIR